MRSGCISPRRSRGSARSGVGVGTHVAERAGAPKGRDVLKMERETGFEPATSTLARSHSTTELFPRASRTALSNGRRQPLSVKELWYHTPQIASKARPTA